MDERVFDITESDAGERLDRFLTKQYEDRSRTQIQAWIKAGRVAVDEKVVPARHVIEAGESIRVEPPEIVPTTLQPLDIPLECLFEDADLAVIDKPAGLQVHPGAGEPRDTLVHALLWRYPDWEAPGPPDRPGIVHRLDRETSGLMVVARSNRGYQGLGQQIRDREAKRRYIAIAWGWPDKDRGVIDAPIARHFNDRTRMSVRKGGRPATTQWRVLQRFDTLSLLEVALETGRTHQIRVHFAHIGLPILGDPVYGKDAEKIALIDPRERPLYYGFLRSLNRQALHAYHLAFRHPADGKRFRFEAPLPADMDGVLTRLIERERTE